MVKKKETIKIDEIIKSIDEARKISTEDLKEPDWTKTSCVNPETGEHISQYRRRMQK